MKRVFLIVLDSLGIGALPDSEEYGDVKCNTLAAIAKSTAFNTPTLRSMGLFNIDSVKVGKRENAPIASYCRLGELSKGKDTTTGHWEMAGLVSELPMKVYPEGFPEEIISELERRTGRKVLCNKPYSGTQVIADFGEEQIKQGAIIVYTSADSVMQIAAHESVIPIEELYAICRIAREIMTGDNSVGRIIARPFSGESPDFFRTKNRHDFSLAPPSPTLLDILKGKGFSVIGLGKIFDIFNGNGITESYTFSGNTEGMNILMDMTKRAFVGLCFLNLVDFDMVYGHRNDVDGYAKAVSEFDFQLSRLIRMLNKEDVVIITADHGCDPSTVGTDHTREYVPMLIYGDRIKNGENLGTRETMADIAMTIGQYLGVGAEGVLWGNSFLAEVLKDESL